MEQVMKAFREQPRLRETLLLELRYILRWTYITKGEYIRAYAALLNDQALELNVIGELITSIEGSIEILEDSGDDKEELEIRKRLLHVMERMEEIVETN